MTDIYLCKGRDNKWPHLKAIWKSLKKLQKNCLPERKVIEKSMELYEQGIKLSEELKKRNLTATGFPRNVQLEAFWRKPMAYSGQLVTRQALIGLINRVGDSNTVKLHSSFPVITIKIKVISIVVVVDVNIEAGCGNCGSVSRGSLGFNGCQRTYTAGRQYVFGQGYTKVLTGGMIRKNSG